MTLEWYHFGLKNERSRIVVRRLSLLFAMDLFARGAISMMRSGFAGSRFSFLGACVLKSNGEQFGLLGDRTRGFSACVVFYLCHAGFS